jgi:hypothetical protein
VAKGKFNDELVRNIEQLLEEGISNKQTCEAVGISDVLFYSWIKKDPRPIWHCKCVVKGKDIDGNSIEINKLWEKKPKSGKCRKCKGRITKKLKFLNRIKKARVKGQRKHLKNIRDAGSSHWQASAWTLERTNPGDYALKNNNNGKKSKEREIEPYKEFLKRFKQEEGE